MELKDQVLLYFNKLNNNDRIYIKDEFTRNRIETHHNEVCEYTLLERLNGIVWTRHHDSSERVKVSRPETMGELGYPERFETKLQNVSHIIKNVRIEDDKLLGDIKIIDTWKGTQLAEMIEKDPDSIVFRPRSTGIINEKNQVVNLVVFSFDAINKKEDSFNNIQLN